ncbi:bacillithiol biosynthesis cysteine-adding enzyme BshC [Rhodohalobacter sp. SW132]|uniref:bacillithiol biosynthesis cysteine-adding enzyme BshC n=1 Tax=Rhodohalobacter sp. SW132 TaxID=2293433 RepID=UPI000E283045|nr:bacillithiol biosynthesis cysteine-adding enzyme BshC [Rhodohalobacter sp. SW132]REL38215.1 bacillithiol biosynthesis cysteine-adding enzyme BshC [Rhodohalobacter sp. SW132]
MEVTPETFENLPFSKLFKDYINGNEEILRFFTTGLPDRKVLSEYCHEFSFTGDREHITDLLLDFNQTFSPSDRTIREIESLRDPDTVAVVTGQQVSLFGGPLFTIYKTITAILTAKNIEADTGRKVVPVFWLADEDHDIEEVSAVKLFQADTTDEFTYKHKDYQYHPPAAGNIHLGDEFVRFEKKVEEQLDETDFTDRLLNELRKYYTPEQTFAQSFGRWLLSIFEDDGLILAGNNHKKIKEFTKDVFITAVDHQNEISNLLDDTTYNLIDAGYHGQVDVNPSNLFYFDDNGRRIKIHFEDDKWRIPDKDWNSAELIAEIDSDPERFSPNVFLRPVIQDHLLPVIGYVGGPGEIAYYAQMKEIYPVFDKQMPPIIPRFSLTLIESAIDRILGELPFEWTDYQQRIEDLEQNYIEKTEEHDVEKMFTVWQNHIEELSRVKKQQISEIDPTLAGSVGKATAAYFNELEKVKGKVYRSMKKQDQIQIDRIMRIKQNLFPNGNLQEREIAFVYYMNRYGLNIWDYLMDALQDEEPFSHKMIWL